MHYSVSADCFESVEHGAPEKGEPEEYPSMGARDRWEDDNDNDAEDESRWMRMACSNPRQEGRFETQDDVPSAAPSGGARRKDHSATPEGGAHRKNPSAAPAK